MTRRIGVFLCQCGTNISDKVDFDLLASQLSTEEDVVLVEPYRLLCSPDGKVFLEKRMGEEGLTHVVVAACSPRDHQGTFMGACERAGLNPYLFQLANIREQCAWMTEDASLATEKALRMVRAAVRRVRMHAPLEKREIEINPDVLVVGGGISGLEASLRLASPNRRVILVERALELGGMARNLMRAYPSMGSLPEMIQERIDGVEGHKDIEVHTGTEVQRVLGFLGNFEITLRSGADLSDVKVGAIIIATGARVHDPRGSERYGSGGQILTALDAERLLSTGGLGREGKLPGSVAMIHCAGREDLGYCSGFCCMESLKLSRVLMETVPGIKVTHLYRDMCVPGKDRQDFMEGTMALGAEMTRVSEARVEEEGDGVGITFLDESGEERRLVFDMAILSTGMIPSEGSEALAEVLEIPLGRGGFITEKHQKLDPVLTVRDGIFAVGCAIDPKGMEECMWEAEAAAGAILTSLVPGQRIEPEVKISIVSEEFCQGCGSCVTVCPYGAVSLDERRKVAVVNEVICRGCGNCVAACPSGAASIRHATYDQIYQEIMEAVR